ncbi:hypothetical protein K432DRAFT_447531 [Lepidopterella palustris CBS 459.81]|uniref:Uncharacterized protein n=1 Tax=Lepidopterella palustris CBS 459.81 TaxID=1314670 RepID=A0A8E2DYC3_9PEZI|nr:hypothetical protein K432DRAFT_447531 [Lepidopterella palustris CBS 459.81]
MPSMSRSEDCSRAACPYDPFVTVVDHPLTVVLRLPTPLILNSWVSWKSFDCWSRNVCPTLILNGGSISKEKWNSGNISGPGKAWDTATALFKEFRAKQLLVRVIVNELSQARNDSKRALQLQLDGLQLEVMQMEKQLIPEAVKAGMEQLRRDAVAKIMASSSSNAEDKTTTRRNGQPAIALSMLHRYLNFLNGDLIFTNECRNRSPVSREDQNLFAFFVVLAQSEHVRGYFHLQKEMEGLFQFTWGRHTNAAAPKHTPIEIEKVQESIEEPSLAHPAIEIVQEYIEEPLPMLPTVDEAQKSTDQLHSSLPAVEPSSAKSGSISPPKLVINLPPQVEWIQKEFLISRQPTLPSRLWAESTGPGPPPLYPVPEIPTSADMNRHRKPRVGLDHKLSPITTPEHTPESQPRPEPEAEQAKRQPGAEEVQPKKTISRLHRLFKNFRQSPSQRSTNRI